MDGEKVTLRIFRKSQLINRFRSFSLLLNNEKIAIVKNGQELNIQVPSGDCVIQVKLDWCKSKPLKLYLEPGKTSDFLVGCKIGKVWGIISGIEAMIRTFIPHAYLYMEEIDLIDE